jgi:hypothetical protein
MHSHFFRCIYTDSYLPPLNTEYGYRHFIAASVQGVSIRRLPYSIGRPVILRDVIQVLFQRYGWIMRRHPGQTGACIDLDYFTVLATIINLIEQLSVGCY